MLESNETARRQNGGRAPALVPVYSVWQESIGPVLSLGMLSAAARTHRSGALARTFEIRRPETASSFLADLAQREGPAILLSSDYVWSLDHNLELARAAVERNPELIVVHGGPSCPKYEGDAAAFLHANAGAADVLVRGEGEATLCHLLDVWAEVLAESRRTRADLLGCLPGAQVEGITFVDHGVVVRTADRDRIADLDQLASPYLTGEFDDIEQDVWRHGLSIETNRGCPYGCTFCDWGSATMSRIRKFDIDRVRAEIDWAASRGIDRWMIADANFGILKRDIEIVEHIVAAHDRWNAPQALALTPAKNTIKHITKVLDLLFESDIQFVTSIALQTTDADTLEAVQRSNISTDAYLALAADLRRRSVPVVGDCLIGMPGQTYDSYAADLRFFREHEITARTFLVQLLPNAPMNEPSYRARHEIETRDDGVVVGTRSFTPADRARMVRLRTVDTISDRMGLLRHLLRWLTWDLGIDSTAVLERIMEISDERPADYPLVAWVYSYFDLLPTAAISWRAFYDEVRRFLVDEFDVPGSSALDSVLALQLALMPSAGRTFPDSTQLEHDYVAYYRSATERLYVDGIAQRPERPLAAYPPATFTVAGDPFGLCERGLQLDGESREELQQGDFHNGSTIAHELASPLVRVLPPLTSIKTIEWGLDDDHPVHAADRHAVSAAPGGLETSGVAVALLGRRADPPAQATEAQAVPQPGG